MKIIETKWKWNGHLGKRSGQPPMLVHHNAAATTCTAADVHRWHQANGWLGIAYHYFIRKDGAVYRGRPEWAVGGHTFKHGTSIGICSEGNFDKEQMPQKQRDAVRELTREIHGRYPAIKDMRHKDVPDNATSCPGKNYPFAYVTAKAEAKHVTPKVDNMKLKQAMMQYALLSGIRVTGWERITILSPGWGKHARMLAWRVSGRVHETNAKVPRSQHPTPELYAALVTK